MSEEAIHQRPPLRLKLKGPFCVYCGEPSDDQEFFPPRTHAVHGYTLPVCRECKNLANRAHPFDFKERADYIKSKLRDRLQRVLRTPDWSSNELEEIGRDLRDGIAAWQKMREISKDRIAWNALSYLAQIDECSDFLLTYVEREFLEANKWRW